jgi:hypothetical protein
MPEYSKRKLKLDEAIRYLYDKELQYDFVREYSFFGKDGNSAIYIRFINETLETKNDDAIYNALEIAELIGYFTNEVLEKARAFLASGIRWDTKTAGLHYLTAFYSRIDQETFYNLNLETYKRSRNTHVRLTALINLLLVNEEKFSKPLLKILKRSDYPAPLYAVLNTIATYEILENSVSNHFLKEIQTIINNSTFSEGVKGDLAAVIKAIS